MYCPKCAAPIDGVKFCRQCGTNVSLVPQALTGQLPAPAQTDAMQTMSAPYGRRHRRHRQAQPEGPPSMAHVFNKVLVGLGFLAAVAIVMSRTPSGMSWGWAFLFPAMGAFGAAVSEYYRVAEARQQARWQQPANPSLPIQSTILQPQVQVPTTSELKLPPAAQDFAQDLAQPVSITEHTTALPEPARHVYITLNLELLVEPLGILDFNRAQSAGSQTYADVADGYAAMGCAPLAELLRDAAKTLPTTESVWL